MIAKILWIQGKRAFGPPLIPGMQEKGYVIETVSTGSEALEQLLVVDPDVIVLNAASMRSTGVRICRLLRDQADSLPIVVISASENPANKNLCANVVLALPFTTRKLVNRIKPLLPGDEKDMLRAGPIQLDVKTKRVLCQGRLTSLTPRLVHLLKMLMEHQGEALQRERLFREVWNTEYTGDTRTLDVHISWLRRALEEDPRKPQFLRTIRGVGYRLDV